MKNLGIQVAMLALALLHLCGLLWCILGGLNAATSDRVAFQAVAEPLRASEGITASALQTLEQNVAKRSVTHARVMYSYAAVHGITALGFIAAFVALRSRKRVLIAGHQRA